MASRPEYGYAGAWTAFADAHVPLDDRGFLLGDAVFETLRVEGHVWLAEQHWKRLRGSLQALGLPLSALVQVRAVVQTRPPTEGPYVLRVTVTRGAGAGLRPFRQARVYASLRPATPTQTPVALRTAGPRPEAFLPWHAKHASYLGSILQLKGAPKDTELAWLDARGRYLESGTGNLLFLVKDKLVTPPLDGRILGGTTREALVRALGIEERHVRGRVEAAWVTSAIHIARPVRSIDGTRLSVRKTLTETLLREYRRVACGSPSSS